VYSGNPPSRRTLVTVQEDGFYAQEWTFGEHSGTHMDAPGHFVVGGRLVPQLRPRELILPIVVIDISSRAASNPDTVVTSNDLRRFERRHGRIPRRALVAMDSGWSAKIGTPAFTGRDASGTYHFPGFGPDAIEFLLERRRAAAIGVDTLSLDHGPSTTFTVHKQWLGADNYGIENLANLDAIPRHGAVASVGVIPWEEGSGGPARVLATY
jgi:kynurenine formamidase